MSKALRVLILVEGSIILCTGNGVVHLCEDIGNVGTADAYQVVRIEKAGEVLIVPASFLGWGRMAGGGTWLKCPEIPCLGWR